MELADKVALVTGSALRLGKNIALGLAEEGMHIVVHYGGSAGAAEETAAEISGLGVEAISVQADLGQTDSIESLFEAARARFGRLDVLVNSAANFEKKPFLDVTLDDWHKVMSVNLRAPFLCSQHAARLMIEGEGGTIINITDLMGITPRETFPIHSVSKGGLIHLTRVMALALAPEIRVNAIAPGAILPPATLGDTHRWDMMVETLPVSHTGDPVNVQQAVTMLAKNDFMTGHVLVVDGGESLLGPFSY